MTTRLDPVDPATTISAQPGAAARQLAVSALMDINVPRVLPQHTLGEVLREMRAGRGKYALVVSQGHFRGLVAERDIRLALPSRFASPSEQQLALATVTAEEVCIALPYRVAPETSLQAAIELMLDRDIGALPVLQGTVPLGLLTMRDLARGWLGLSRADAPPAARTLDERAIPASNGPSSASPAVS